MNLLDLTIIYLACGMPFAVYRFALGKNGAAESAVTSIRAALIWPIDGSTAAVKRLRVASRSLTKPRIEVVRIEIEELLAAEHPYIRRFEFREALERYVGLAGAVNSATQPAMAELFQISGIQPTPTADACVRRAAQTRIERQAAAARCELIEYLATASSPRVFELAATLATELSDESLSEQISRHHRETPITPPASLSSLSGSAS